MQQIKNWRTKNWIACLLTCLCYINLYGQQSSDDSVEQVATSSDFPRVISNDCDPSEEKCTGTIVWEDGSKYEGEFQNGSIHGQGKLSFPDGSYYEGEFEKEFFHGQGMMIYEDGSKYIGDWVLGYREGEGALVYPDGTEYLGEFESDQIHGEGSMILSTGESYSGSWEHGQTNGFGMITRLDGSVYLGMNEEGARHGSGMIVWESGDTLHGSWLDGKMIDEGTFQFEDGSTMISYWENGIMKDENIYIKTDGEQFASSTKELADDVLQNSWQDMQTVERNFGLAFYAIGLEYKSMMDFDRAVEHLQFAMQFGDPVEDFSIEEMVKTQMANISSEKENNGGVAKSTEEDHK